MSIFSSEFLPQLNQISIDYIKNCKNDLEAAFQCFDKFEVEFQNGRSKGREKAPKEKDPVTTLQSIHEDEDESKRTPDAVEVEKPKRRSSGKSTKSADEARSSLDSNGERRGSKKRSKNEVDGILSPEQDKRQKRNASVKAQSIITKQVNVNLTQKLRREESTDKSRRRRGKDAEGDKENLEPVPIVQVKQEKISLPQEPMDMEALPLDIEVKSEVDKDEMAMPPPAAPVPKSRKAVQKERSEESTDDESDGGGGRPARRTTRTRKQTDTMPPPAAAGARATRASSRSARQTQAEDAPAPDARPKRTRGKKKAETESSNGDLEKVSQPSSQENGIASPAEKPRPKRTRRAQKEKVIEQEDVQKPEEPPIPPENEPKELPALQVPKEERISQPEAVQSPIIQSKAKFNKKPINRTKQADEVDSQSKIDLVDDTTRTILVQDTLTATDLALEETRVIATDSRANGDMDKTVVLPNGVYNHAPVTPTNVRKMNETVVVDKPKMPILDATVVIERDPAMAAAAAAVAAERLSDDNSLLTNDSDEACTPPRQPPALQPTSAVKEKVQQFEELASRVTRTKTRAMAKKDEPAENQTPPDKISKPVLSADTLAKMNSMIFNGKAPQISSSASKPRAIPVAQTKTVPASASKLSGINKAREAEEQKREKEDARRKKEALLEAKRELQKRKREEKMAAAAAAREQAERERRAALEVAARDRLEKQAHVQQGKLERMREVERRKQELARKVAETEERRKAEELARQQRLAEEQRRADEARRKQIEEAEAMKKEEAIMAREYEMRKKEYIEKQKLKQRLEGDKISTPLKTAGTPGGLPLPPMEPVYMADGFQYLNSDEEAEPVERPVPVWSTSKGRRQLLHVQARVGSHHIDKLFSVREHTPDLREIFPNIERVRLKRTSSAVWRTPPARLPVLRE